MQESDLLNLGFKRITEYDPMDIEHPEWYYYELSIGDLHIISTDDYTAKKNGFWHVMFNIYDSDFIIERPKTLQNFINILDSSLLEYI